MKKLVWLLFALVVFGVVLLAFLPARFALEHGVDPRHGLTFSGVSGTAWNGHANEVALRGKPLGALDWKLDPFALLKGRKHADLSISGGEYRGTATVETGGGAIRVTDANMFFPVARLSTLLDVPRLQFLGEVNLKLDRLTLVDSIPTELAGEAVWASAAVSGAAQATFGTLRAQFMHEGSGIVGTLSDDGDGPLQLSGNFSGNPLGYRAEAVLRARDDNPQVREALNHIGQPQGDGSVIYRMQGGLLGDRQ